MYGEVGVNVEALPKAEAAELLAETMARLGGRFGEIAVSLSYNVSQHVNGGLHDYCENTLMDIQATARSGIALAQDVQGSVLETVATDTDNAEEFEEGLERLNIPVNF